MTTTIDHAKQDKAVNLNNNAGLDRSTANSFRYFYYTLFKPVSFMKCLAYVGKLNYDYDNSSSIKAMHDSIRGASEKFKAYLGADPLFQRKLASALEYSIRSNNYSMLQDVTQIMKLCGINITTILKDTDLVARKMESYVEYHNFNNADSLVKVLNPFVPSEQLFTDNVMNIISRKMKGYSHWLGRDMSGLESFVISNHENDRIQNYLTSGDFLKCVQGELQQKIHYDDYESVNNIIEFMERCGLRKEIDHILSSEKFFEIIQQKIVYHLSSGRPDTINDILQIMSPYYSKEELLNTEEAKSAMVAGLKHDLIHFFPPNAEKMNNFMRDYFTEDEIKRELSNREFVDQMQESITSGETSYYFVLYMAETFNYMRSLGLDDAVKNIIVNDGFIQTISTYLKERHYYLDITSEVLDTIEPYIAEERMVKFLDEEFFPGVRRRLQYPMFMSESDQKEAKDMISKIKKIGLEEKLVNDEFIGMISESFRNWNYHPDESKRVILINFIKNFSDENILRIFSCSGAQDIIRQEITAYWRFVGDKNFLSYLKDFNNYEEIVGRLCGGNIVTSEFSSWRLESLKKFLENNNDERTINALFSNSSNVIVQSLGNILIHRIDSYPFHEEELNEVFDLIKEREDVIQGILAEGVVQQAVLRSYVMRNRIPEPLEPYFGKEKINEIFKSDIGLDVMLEKIKDELSFGSFSRAVESIRLIEEHYDEGEKKIAEFCRSNDSDIKKELIGYIPYFGDQNDYSVISKYFDVASFFKDAMQKFGCNSVEELRELDYSFRRYIVSSDSEQTVISRKILGKRFDTLKKYCLYGIQKEVEENGLDFLKEKDNEKFYQAVFNVLVKQDSKWEYIAEQFAKGAEYFGYANMFKFITGKNFNNTYLIHEFNDVCALCDKLGTSKEDRLYFFNNILDQVRNSTAEDEENGTSYDLLNKIAKSLSGAGDIDSMINTVRNAGMEWGENLKDRHAIFSSWNDLVGFAYIYDIACNKDLLDKLRGGKEINPALYEYCLSLLGVNEVIDDHGNSFILRVDDKHAVGKFASDPDDFLSRTDYHSRGLSNRLKPSNYLQNGLTGEMLRDAYVNGTLDPLSRMRPFFREYVIREKPLTGKGGALDEAIGSYQEKRRGLAKDPDRLRNALSAKGIDPKTQVKIKNWDREKPEEEVKISEEERKIIWEALDNEEYGMPVKKYEVIAMVHRKSDVRAAAIGDGTRCCMGAGKGKTNEYWYNQNCAEFSVWLKNSKGKYEVIAQSVLMADVDVETLNETTEKGLVLKIMDGQTNIPLHVFNKPLVLTCDNIQIAPNASNKERLIDFVYDITLNDYLDEYAESSNLDRYRVVIGTWYLNPLDSIENCFVPGAPTSYSDNFGTRCLRREFSGGTEPVVKGEGSTITLDDKGKTDIKMDLTLVREEKSERIDIEAKNQRQISNINPSDVLMLYCMQKSTFNAETSSVDMAIFQNELMSSLIKNTINSSEGSLFKMRSSNNAPLGYVMAYERQLEGGNSELYVPYFVVRDIGKEISGESLKAEEEYSNENIGRNLTFELFERYARQHKDDNNPPPISVRFGGDILHKLTEGNEELARLLKDSGLRISTVEKDETGTKVTIERITEISVHS